MNAESLYRFVSDFGCDDPCIDGNVVCSGNVAIRLDEDGNLAEVGDAFGEGCIVWLGRADSHFGVAIFEAAVEAFSEAA